MWSPPLPPVAQPIKGGFFRASAKKSARWSESQHGFQVSEQEPVAREREPQRPPWIVPTKPFDRPVRVDGDIRRKSTSLLAYTLFLSLHTIGLAFLVGFNAAIGLRILGVAPGLPLAPMLKFFPFMVAGFSVNAVTGVVLLTTAPTDFLTNVVF